MPRRGLLLFAWTMGCQAPPAPAFLPDAACGYGGEGQPAIAFSMALHYHASSSGELGFYERSRDEERWLVGWAEQNGLLLELGLNGYYAEGALAMGEQDRFRELYEAGHGFGVHHHATARLGELSWIDMTNQATDEELQRAVDDHRQWIGAALDPLGIPFEAGHVRLTGRSPWWDAMMRESGYTSETLDAWIHAATEGAEDRLDFDLLHPFRWALDGAPGSLEYDPEVPYVLIPHHTQPGTVSEGGHLRHDGAVAHIATELLLAYLEWRAATLAGEPPRVWVFGVTVHPDRGTQDNDDLRRLATFLQDHFLDPPAGGPGRSMCAATRDDILRDYEAWEDELAPEAPFRFAPGEAYPYRLPQLEAVYPSHLIEVDDGQLDRGVRIALLAEMEDSGEGDVEDLVPQHRWLIVWADAEQPVKVDLRPWTDQRVRPWTSEGLGDEVRPSALWVSDEPVVVQLD
jgi:hypothetical protein